MISEALSMISIFALGGFAFSLWQFKNESEKPVGTAWCIIAIVAMIKVGMAIQASN